MRRVPGCCSVIGRCGVSCARGVDDGADVRQLEENLVALGFAPDEMVVDEEFDADTTTAIRAWQESAGCRRDRSRRARRTSCSQPASAGCRRTSDRSAARLTVRCSVLTGVNQIVALDVAADDVDRFAVGDESSIELPDGTLVRRRRVVDRPGRHRRRRRRRHDGRGRRRADRTDGATRRRSGRRDRHHDDRQRGADRAVPSVAGAVGGWLRGREGHRFGHPAGRRRARRLR